MFPLGKLGEGVICVYWVPGFRGGTRNRKVLFLEVGMTLFGVVEINLMVKSKSLLAQEVKTEFPF